MFFPYKMIQSIPVLQTQEASEGVSASQETLALYQGPAAGMWETKYRLFLQGEEHHCSNHPNRNHSSGESTSAALGPGRHENTIQRSNESGTDNSLTKGEKNTRVNELLDESRAAILPS